MPSLFSGPPSIPAPPPSPAPPPVMPVINQGAIAQAQQQQSQKAAATSGRASTILTDSGGNQKLGQ